MPIQHVPLLRMQRDLHHIPRGMERFHAYLNTIVNDTGDDIRYVPLVAMNPMGREHVVARLDELLALDADAIAAEAIDEAVARFGGLDSNFEHGLVILDDVAGGWTNRTTTDATFRFGYELPTKRLWITTGWWVSETPSRERIRQVVLASACRYVYIQQHGAAKTLREIMNQEGTVGAFAGLTPQLDEEELDYSRQVIAPHLDSTAYPVQIAALYGDNAAVTLGYTALGLSDNAGFAVALADALAKGETQVV